MNIYEDTVLENCQFPFNFFKLTTFKVKTNGFNNSCGDNISVYFNTIKKNVPIQLSFYGDGCSISKAYSSLIIKYVGKSSTITVLIKMRKVGNLFMYSNKESTFKNDYVFLVSNILKYPDRLKCGTLGFNTIGKVFSLYFNTPCTKTI